MKIGEVDRTQYWYTLSDGKIVSFHVAYTNKERTESVFFMSDDEHFASKSAELLDIPYVFIRNATTEEVNEFFESLGIPVPGLKEGEE